MNRSLLLTEAIVELIESIADRVRSTKALYLRPGTPGEKDAAKSALDRMRVKHGDVHGLGKSHDDMIKNHMGSSHTTSSKPSSSTNKPYKPERQQTPQHGFYAKNDHKYTGPFGSREGAEDFAHYKNHFKPHVVHHDGETGKWTETSATAEGRPGMNAGRTTKKHKLDAHAEFYNRHPADD